MKALRYTRGYTTIGLCLPRKGSVLVVSQNPIHVSLATMTPHALIIGSGIAGPALALALRQLDFTVDIFEARPSASNEEGGFFNVAPNDINVLRQLGVADRLVRDGFTTRGFRFQNARGREVGKINWANQRERFGAENLMLKRAWVHRALQEEAERKGAEVLYAKRLASVQHGDRGVVAYFKDGTSAAGDVLFGCDGVRSAVRRSAFPDAPAPEFTGLINGHGFTRLAPGAVEPGLQHMVFGRRAFFGYVAQPNGEVWWFTNFPWPHEPRRGELDSISTESWRERLLTQHADDSAPIPELISRAHEVWVSWPDVAMPSIPEWHRGRICLLGDAVHAVPPASGQGASLALEDALVLAKCLHDSTQPEEAFAAFERLRRDRVEKIVAQARRTGNRKAPGPVGAFFRDLLMPLFLKAGEKHHEAVHAFRVEWQAPSATDGP